MQYGFFKRNSDKLIILLSFFDFLMITLSAYAAYYLKFNTVDGVPEYYKYAIIIGSALSFLVFIFSNIYKAKRGYSSILLLRQFIVNWVIIFLLFVVLGVFLLKENKLFSREWLLLWAGMGFLLTYVSHALLYGVLHLLRKQGYNQRHVAIIGAGELGQTVFQKIKSEEWVGYNITRFYDDNAASAGGVIGGIPILQIPEEFQQDISEYDIDEVWICLPLRAQNRIKKIMRVLRFSTVNIRLIPDLFGLNLLRHEVTQLAGMPTIILRQTPMQGFNRLIKAFEDRALASLILLLISPIFILIALLVKATSRGPIFYKQCRVSWNGKSFGMLKFRSMETDAENHSGAVWAAVNDPRTTKLGAFLRKTSLDELPQFINVLKGDMSIVGPRPERPEFISKFKYEIPNYMQKHMVRAGITGWAQVNGLRGNTSLEKRIEYDLAYIQHWSLLLDLKIIFLTLLKGFVNKNAY